MERESIDLNSERIRTFNSEMLRIGGIVMRIAWLGEMESLKNSLSRQLAKPTDRLSKEMIAKVLPEATLVKYLPSVSFFITYRRTGTQSIYLR